MPGTRFGTQDYTFISPSTAAGVLLGRSANGRIDWKDARRTLKELQEAAGRGVKTVREPLAPTQDTE